VTSSVQWLYYFMYAMSRCVKQGKVTVPLRCGYFFNGFPLQIILTTTKSVDILQSSHKNEFGLVFSDSQGTYRTVAM